MEITAPCIIERRAEKVVAKQRMFVVSTADPQPPTI